MSAKRYKLTELSSRQRIRQAMINFEKMPKEKRIDLMVEAGVMTLEQAERAKKKIAENPA